MSPANVASLPVANLLRPFGNFRSTWIEITKAEHGHGGTGWEFGKCLWSPSENASGNDRYAVMRRPVKGDQVLHFYSDPDSAGHVAMRLCARSIVASSYKELATAPPSPGGWAGRPSYYRIDLTKFIRFPAAISLEQILHHYADDIRRDILENEPTFYPFNKYGAGIRTVTGIYLAQCTSPLYDIFCDALDIANAPSPDLEATDEAQSEYGEGKRYSRERRFFSRNPQLVADAKRYYGFSCQACTFNFRQFYGPVGEEYIECHHLNPLSERPPTEWTQQLVTTLADVTVLCSNCHRMVHRSRPAMPVDELRRQIELARH